MKKSGTVYWICGLAGSGKTTIAERFTQKLKQKGINPILLDGDNMREIFNLYKYDRGSRFQNAMNYPPVLLLLV